MSKANVSGRLGIQPIAGTDTLINTTLMVAPETLDRRLQIGAIATSPENWNLMMGR